VRPMGWNAPRIVAKVGRYFYFFSDTKQRHPRQ
jgi:hypothetical protein